MLAIISILGMTGLLAGIIIIAFLAVLIFEIWMFIDVFQNHAISNQVRLLWLIGMLLLHPFVALVYFFTDHHKS